MSRMVNDKGSLYQSERTVFDLCSFGKLNPKTIIAYMEAGTETSGFGALLRRTLSGLYIADMFHAVPVISWENSTIINAYSVINGSKNPFEYYFEPVSGITKEEALSSRFVILSNKYDSYVFGEGMLSNIDGQTDEYIELLAAMIKKYHLRIKKPVWEFINTKADRLLGNRKVLGVHIRGGDRRMKVRNVANSVPVSMYFDEIDRLLMQDISYEAIFLATDDEEYLMQFREKYGQMILFYQDMKRSHDNISSFFEIEGTRENNGYLLGLEILLDMYTLLRCESMIGGPSNITLLVRAFRKNYKDWKYFKMLDNGICEDGQLFAEVVRSILNNNGKYELN